MIFRCKHCGNIIIHLYNSGVNVVCCGEEMELLEPNKIEASNEKHIPMVESKDNEVIVTVGSISHPMTEEHYIEWILLKTDKNIYVNYLNQFDEPKTTFLTNEKVQEVYCYCNLHGLWKNN